MRSIQEISRVLGIDRVKVQFWDCSGSSQYQSYWPVLAKVRVRACCPARLGDGNTTDWGSCRHSLHDADRRANCSLQHSTPRVGGSWRPFALQ